MPMPCPSSSLPSCAHCILRWPVCPGLVQLPHDPLWDPSQIQRRCQALDGPVPGGGQSTDKRGLSDMWRESQPSNELKTWQKRFWEMFMREIH